MEFDAQLKYISENMNAVPYGEVMDFMQNAEKNYTQFMKSLDEHQKELKRRKRETEALYSSFFKKELKKDHTRFINLYGFELEFPLIQYIDETKKHPNIPCIFLEVPDWFFIYFPTLKQILPVTYVNDLFCQPEENVRTLIHNGLFGNDLIEFLGKNYAVFPFTKETWKKLETVPKKKWADVLQQMIIKPMNNHYKNTQHMQYYSMDQLPKIITQLKPKDLALNWSLFVQYYFLMYVYAAVGPKHHFCH